MNTEEYFAWLRAQYIDVKEIPGDRWAAIFRMIHTHKIIVGEIGDQWSFSDGWCYEDLSSAQFALAAWDGTGEPEGWHRHPHSGRRRPAGDPQLEYINA